MTDHESPQSPEDFTRQFTAPDGSYLGSAALSASLDAARERQIADFNYRATHDKLTGALNIDGLEDYLENSAHPPLAALLVDADNLKSVNDKSPRKHARGHEAILATYQTIKDSVRPDDIIARTGGDEFVVLFVSPVRDGGQHLSAEELVEHTKARIDTATSELLKQAENQDLLSYGFGLSVGGAVWQEGMHANELIELADADMYIVKEAKKNRTQE